jgi:hypothetical protein
MHKAIGTTKDHIASRGGLYPPWRLMLTCIIVSGVVFPKEVAPWSKCEKRGLETHKWNLA